MTETELKNLTKKTLGWAGELSEEWVGTTKGNVIEYQRKHVQELFDAGDLNLVSVAVLELAQTCENVESESDGY